MYVYGKICTNVCFRNEYPVKIQGIIFSFIVDIKNIILVEKFSTGCLYNKRIHSRIRDILEISLLGKYRKGIEYLPQTLIFISLYLCNQISRVPNIFQTILSRMRYVVNDD